jgi:hypothetical protein
MDKARIYLSKQRGITQSEAAQSFYTLNVDTYPREQRQSFHAIAAVNDHVLHAGKILPREIHADTLIFLLPVLGAIEVNINDRTIPVDVEEHLLLHLKAGSKLFIKNSYEEESVNFIEVHFKPGGQVATTFNPFVKCAFTLDPSDDMPKQILAQEKINGYISILRARTQQVFQPKQDAHGLFVFVIDGAFEFHNRLLESGDALSLEGIEEVSFEALSDKAIVFILEV